MNDEKQELQDNFDSDLRDMVATYQALKKLGIIGGWIFGGLMALAAFVASLLEIIKLVKGH